MGYMAIRIATEPAEGTAQSETLSGPELDRHIETIRGAVQNYFDRGELEPAETILSSALQKQPNNKTLRTLNAELRMWQGRAVEAYEEMQIAYKVGPDSPELRYAAAYYANEAGLFEDAITEARRAISLSTRPDLRFYQFLGALELKLNRIADARATLMLALAIDDSHAPIYGMLAEMDLREGGTEKGLEFAIRARQLDPHQVAYRVTEARLFRRLGRLDAALSTLTGIDEYTRLTNFPILRDVVVTLQGLGQHDRAADFASRAAEASPSDVDIMMLSADAMDAAGRLNEAIEFARRARMLGHPHGDARVEHLTAKRDQLTQGE